MTFNTSEVGIQKGREVFDMSALFSSSVHVEIQHPARVIVLGKTWKIITQIDKKWLQIGTPFNCFIGIFKNSVHKLCFI